jgi:hypothetical protein
MELQKYKSDLSQASLHFEGWIEPTPEFVGFRCTQSNLHFAGDNLEMRNLTTADFQTKFRSFFCDLPVRFLASGWADT